MLRCLLKTQLKSLILLRRPPPQTFSSIQCCHSKNASDLTPLAQNANTDSKEIHEFPVASNTEENATADADRARKLQILKLEVSVLRQEGRKSPDPDLLSKDQWERLLSLPTKSARYKYYTFLWSTEKKKENIQVRTLWI